MITSIFLAVTLTFDLPPGLLDSVCFIETRHNVSALVEHDGGSPSYGVCQVKLSTARDMGFKGKPEHLMIPEINAYYAGKYLSRNLKKYRQIERAVIAYNRGHAGELNTTAYSNKVLTRWRGGNDDTSM